MHHRDVSPRNRKATESWCPSERSSTRTCTSCSCFLQLSSPALQPISQPVPQASLVCRALPAMANTKFLAQGVCFVRASTELLMHHAMWSSVRPLPLHPVSHTPYASLANVRSCSPHPYIYATRSSDAQRSVLTAIRWLNPGNLRGATA